MCSEVVKADVVVVIVTYNSGAFIDACLESVLAGQTNVTRQVVVVDNASKDDTCARIRANFPDVLLLEPGRNLGFAAGVNYGVRETASEFVLLLNPDTQLRPHAVDAIVGFARCNPRYGLYGGRTLNSDGSLNPLSCLGEPTLWSTALFALGVSRLLRGSRIFDPESLGTWERDSVREVGVISGCFLLTRRHTWEELGGFDERYFMYGEDVDLAVRARRRGYRPVLCPDAELVHELGASSDTPADKSLLLYRGKATLIRSHWRGVAKQLGLCFLATGVAIRSVLTGDRRWRALWRERSEWMKGYGIRVRA